MECNILEVSNKAARLAPTSGDAPMGSDPVTTLLPDAIIAVGTVI